MKNAKDTSTESFKKAVKNKEGIYYTDANTGTTEKSCKVLYTKVCKDLKNSGRTWHSRT